MVFKLQAGYPRGHQAGSIMAMAALGDPEKYEQDLMRMARLLMMEQCKGYQMINIE